MEKVDIKSESNSKVIWASEFAAALESSIVDISYRIHTIDGIKKVLYSLSFAGDDGWSDRMTVWDTHLPTEEDLEALKGKKIVDVMLLKGKNPNYGIDPNAKEYGKTKVDKLVLEGGFELTFSGGTDKPGLGDTEDDD